MPVLDAARMQRATSLARSPVLYADVVTAAVGAFPDQSLRIYVGR
jgi:hypothetical protein